MLNNVLVGAIAMASLITGLFFLRFWKSSRDRFFLYFALSFLIDGCSRVFFTFSRASDEDLPVFYLIRLLAYGLILVAILEKNNPWNKSK